MFSAGDILKIQHNMTSTANITHHTTVTMASHSEEEEDLLTDMTPPDVC